MNELLKDRINELKSEIDALRPLDKDTEARIQQKFRLDWNYHSNNIEGNSLTFGETKTFLLHGITADGKPLKDHLDIKGHNEAILMLEDVIKDGRPLNENFIRELHQIILHEPYEKPAVTPDGKQTTRTINVGQYKTQPNHVITKTGETFFFAKPEETPAMMNDLMVWYNEAIEGKKLHPVELAALLHYKFIRIHPFDDGNGRISRILMNLALMKFGFPPVIIKTQKKDEYYRALQQADGGDTSFFVNYISELEIDSLELYLKGAKGESIEEHDDLDKEIALFKAKLSRDSGIQHFRTIESQKVRFQDSLKPLIQTLFLKLTSFNELFARANCNYRFENFKYQVSNIPILQPIGEIDNIESFLFQIENRFGLDTDFANLYLFFNWHDLLTSKNQFSHIEQSILFDFHKDRYQIRYDGAGQNSIEKNYSEKLTTDDIKNIVSESIRHLMNNIELLKT